MICVTNVGQIALWFAAIMEFAVNATCTWKNDWNKNGLPYMVYMYDVSVAICVYGDSLKPFRRGTVYDIVF